MFVKEYFLGKLWGKDLDMDLVVVYTPHATDYLTDMKHKIEEIFNEYLLEHVTVWYM
jgi:hypothetical protein